MILKLTGNLLLILLLFNYRYEAFTWYKSNKISTKHSIVQPFNSGLTKLFALQKLTSYKVDPKFSQQEKDLRLYINTKAWKNATSLISELKSSTFNTGRNLIYVITETCRRNREYFTIMPLLQSIPESSGRMIQCSEDDVMPLLSECASNKNMRVVQPIISLLEGKGVAFTAKTYSVLVKGYGRIGNEVMINYLLKICNERSIKADTVLLNGFIDSYIRCGSADKALDLFSSVSTIATSLFSSDTLFDYEKTEKSKKMSNVDFFLNSAVEPNLRTYNILLKALRAAGPSNLRKSMNVLNFMRNNGIKTDSITVNTLVDVSVNTGNFLQAEELIMDPLLEPGVEAYTSLISGLAQRRNVTGAFRILDVMIQSGISPNSYTLTSLMSACVKTGKFSLAKVLLQQKKKYLEKLTKRDLSALYGAYVIGLCKLHEDFYQTTYLGRNDFSSVGSEGRAEDRYLREAQMVLIDMELRGIKPDVATMNAFIKCLCVLQPPKIRESLILFQNFLRLGIHPDDYTFSILFTALGKSGYVDQALQLYHTITQDRSLDATAVNSLLRAFVSGPEPLHAIGLFFELTTKNRTSGKIEEFIPDKVTFTLLYLSLAKSVAPEQVTAVRSEVTQKYLPSPRNQYTTPDEIRDSFSASVQAEEGDWDTIDYDKPVKNQFKSDDNVDTVVSVKDSRVYIPRTLRGTKGPPPRVYHKKLTPLLTIYKKIGLVSFASAATEKEVENIPNVENTGEKQKKQETDTLVYDDVGGRLYETDSITKKGSIKQIQTKTVVENTASKPDDPFFEITPDTRALSLRFRSSMYQNPDVLLRELFRSMRYEYKVDPDPYMVKALNSLFSFQGSSKLIPLVGGNRKVFYGFSKETATMIFEDLVVSGVHPNQLLNILQACQYPLRQRNNLLEDPETLKKLRSSAASYRIFNKHGWNKMGSGWSPFF